MELGNYSDMWKAIIRPPRAKYTLDHLGPKEMSIGVGHRIMRTDFQIKNKRGIIIECSHFEPLESNRHWETMPCVIYCHGNSSCRLEALDYVHLLLQANITLLCFDFPGCGLSGGEYISLGWFERDDLQCLVDHMRGKRFASTIGLWGRSMGSVTCLLHGDRDPGIAGMVLDSPFTNLRALVNELAKKHVNVPNFLLSAAIWAVKKSIKSKAGFDIEKLSPIDHVDKCFIPALFATGMQDDFIEPKHCEELHARYAGDKNIIRFEGDHNEQRPAFFNDSVVIFFIDTMQVSQLCNEDNKMSEEKKQFWLQKMEKRKAVGKAQKEAKLIEMKEQLEDNMPNPRGSTEPVQPNSNANDQLSELDKALGLDNPEFNLMNPYEDNMPNQGVNNPYSGGNGGMGQMSEEEMINAAIAASLEPSGLISKPKPEAKPAQRKDQDEEARMEAQAIALSLADMNSGEQKMENKEESKVEDKMGIDDQLQQSINNLQLNNEEKSAFADLQEDTHNNVLQQIPEPLQQLPKQEEDFLLSLNQQPTGDQAEVQDSEGKAKDNNSEPKQDTGEITNLLDL